MSSRQGWYLVIYSAVVTLAFLASALLYLVRPESPARFNELTVERLNLVEKDGTLRLVIANQARMPGAIIRGTEHPHPGRQAAGMLFYNDEGSENGGLIFAGRKADAGGASSGGSLTFDAYEQDQVVQILADQSGPDRRAGLIVSDRPDRSIVADLGDMEKLEKMEPAARDALLAEREEQGYYGQPRLFAGRARDGGSLLRLHDQKGRPRIVMRVAPDGTPSLEFLDEQGKQVQRLPPTTP
jgi:hypothetical protein